MSFGDIRHLLQQPQWNDQMRRQFLSLVQDVYQQTQGQFKQTVLPYIAAFEAHFEQPMGVVTSAKQLLEHVDMLPCARWSVQTTDRVLKHTKRDVVQHTLDHIFALDLTIEKQSKILEIFMQEEGLTALKCLTISSNGMNEQHIEALMQAPFMGQLVDLNLHQSDVDDACVKHITTCPSLTSLVQLDLSENYIGDQGAHMLASCPYFESLQSLNLYDNELTTMGLCALAQSNHLTALKTLSVVFNDLCAASWEAIQQLQARGVKVLI